MSLLLGFLNYDVPGVARLSGTLRFLKQHGVDLDECLEPEQLNSPRSLFERKIRYWDCRPMSEAPDEVVCPADSRVLPGSLRETSQLFIKGKFFDLEDLLGKEPWLEAFADGDFLLCRLTPEKYHYNHVPVSGVVREIYSLEGLYHSCNPGAVVTLATPYSKNKRVVTIIDTDVSGGTGVGFVAMVEVVALMIGEVVQCYSRKAYDAPERPWPGLFLQKGQPKSLFRPGSSTTVLLFQKNRMRFEEDLVRNVKRQDVQSRFSRAFGCSLVETETHVRARVARQHNRRVNRVA